MKKMLRCILAKLLYIIYYKKIKGLLSQTGCVLPIYGHNPSKKTVINLVEFFKNNGFQFISSRELIQFLKGEKEIKKAVWLSLDDGWRGNFSNVYPAVCKYNIPITIFISTKAVQDGYFWFRHAYNNSKSELWDSVYDLWKIPNQDRKRLVAMLPPYKGPRIALNTSEMKIMDNSGLVEFGNHTHDHIICDHTSASEIEEEISCSDDFLSQYKSYIKIFSYPNGNYDKQTVDVLIKHGFHLAATTKPSMINKGTLPFLIPRYEFTDTASKEEIVLSAVGLWSPFFYKIKNVLHIHDPK